VTKSATTAITTVAATGMAVTAVDLTTTTASATSAHAWIQIMYIRTTNAKKIAQFISGRAMVTATTGITCAVATGTVEIAVDTPKMERSYSMPTAKSASAVTRLWIRSVMENVKCSAGVVMATATTLTITAAAIGMAETAVVQSQNMDTARTAAARIQTTRSKHAANPATDLNGRGTKLAMMKTTTAVAIGMVETAVAPPATTTLNIALPVIAWIRRTKLR